jgi:hypothetical protein
MEESVLNSSEAAVTETAEDQPQAHSEGVFTVRLKESKRRIVLIEDSTENFIIHRGVGGASGTRSFAVTHRQSRYAVSEYIRTVARAKQIAIGLEALPIPWSEFHERVGLARYMPAMNYRQREFLLAVISL